MDERGCKVSNRRKARKRTSAPPHATITPGVYILNVRHDDDCPTLRTQRMDDCTCTNVEQVLLQVEDRENES
jgi:hypothetical protein